MTSVKKGDAPVSTLLQQDKDTLSSVADRDAKVRREVEEAMAKFQQASSKYVPFHCVRAERIRYAFNHLPLRHLKGRVT